MFRIDKTFVERMNLNKEVVVIASRDILKEVLPEKPKPPAPETTAEEKVDREAERARRETLDKARDEAEKLLAEAKERAASIEESARQQGYQNGYQQGYQDGMREAEQTISRAVREKEEEAKRVIEKVEAYRQELYQDLLDSVLSLSLDIAEKIINISLERDDLIYKEIAKKAILALESSSKITLRVSPSEYDRFFSQGGQWLGDELGGLPVEVMCDPLLGPGGCIAESEDGVINAGVQDQLQKLSRALF